jgi:hypothetical protein
MMPAFNIFILNLPENGEEEESDKKEERLLSKMLRSKKSMHDDMMVQLSDISNKLRRLPMTSHLGGA